VASRSISATAELVVRLAEEAALRSTHVAISRAETWL